ncbi:MAG: bifunctional metallophosphatase/5'-nucleotidase [Clostridia bacterium]|nr:bifunctional metallophosphatase/5'-nucleotidase [Clostridia bacterium]
MKRSYTNLIVLIVILIGAAAFLGYKYANVNQVLLNLGYYEQKITIANTADIHGHIVYDDEVGTYYSLDEVGNIMGLPLIKHFVDVERKKDNILFLDNGDLFHGTNEANIEKGKGVVEAVNMLGYTATVPGNHDFNFGMDRLMEIKSQINFPILSANIYRDGKLIFDEYKIFNIGGKKVGVFGLTTPVSLSYVKDNTVQIDDPVKCAKRVVGQLRDKVDVLVLLSHLGDDLDREVVKSVDGIDVVFSGHYHQLYEEAQKVNNTYIVEAGSFTTHLGLADLYFKDGKFSKVDWRLETTRDRSLEDKKVAEVVEKYHKIALQEAQKVVGNTKVKLNGVRTQVRSKETNFANLLADAMRDIGEADITLMNGGGIRESIPAGDVNMYQIGKALPFANSLVTLEIKGDEIYKAIERGLRQYPSGSNGPFLQVSGISYVIDGSKQAGERLASVTYNGSPLDKNKYYKVATNDYLYFGGDGYVELKEAKLISQGVLLKDILIEYLKKKGTVEPAEEGRIKVINQRY